MGQGQQEVEQGLHPGLADAVGHHLRCVAEQGDEVGGQQEEQHADDLRQAHRQPHPQLGPLLDPVVLPGPQVLADEGGHGHGQAGDGQKDEALDLGIAAAAGHSIVPEGVDVGLDHQVGDGDDAVLYSAGQTQVEHLLHYSPIRAQPLRGDRHHEPAAHQVGKAQDGAHRLTDGGCEGGPGDPPVKDGHEQQVQHHVEAGGHH